MKRFFVILLMCISSVSFAQEVNSGYSGLWKNGPEGSVLIQKFCENGMQFIAASAIRMDYRAGIGVALIQVLVPNPEGNKYPPVPMACQRDSLRTKGSDW